MVTNLDLWHTLAHISGIVSATTKRKSGCLVARLAPEDKALLERAAGLEGCSVGRFVVSHSRAAAEKVVREREIIRLNLEESRRFIQALLAPPRPPTRRFKTALALYRKTVIERRGRG